LIISFLFELKIKLIFIEFAINIPEFHYNIPQALGQVLDIKNFNARPHLIFFALLLFLLISQNIYLCPSGYNLQINFGNARL